MDEPGNHLDTAARTMLYGYVQSTSQTLIVVSHDRKLLDILSPVCELDKQGITVYGGNYDFYVEQKRMAGEALAQDMQDKEKALRKAKQKKQETMERQQKLDARGKRKHEKAGTARILMSTLRNNAENSTAKTKDVHEHKIHDISQNLQVLRAAVRANA